ncbi:hypothetical protein [Nocardia sp. NBC_00511]|uniref:hypothetical protein n=1 Tax=Nocardia sp. NBC_00511 TaxID=2903591 RepID=UPI0030DF0216
MRIRTCTIAAITAAACVTVAGATAAAEPESVAAPPVTYRTELVDASIVTALAGGTFASTADQRSIEVRDTMGGALDTLPLTAAIDGVSLPLHQAISADGHTLTLTPDLSGFDHATVRPVASPMENQLAMNDLINSVSIGTSIGSLIGTAIGAVAGIGVGIAVAGASCLVLSLGCVVAVLPIVTLVGAAGGLTGLVLAGGPTAAVAAFNYFSTLNAAPGASSYAQQLPGANR